MIIFLGLGNNAAQYLETKHNAGRIILENLANFWNCQFAKQKNFFWANSGQIIEGEKLILLYSTGFMNNSGEILASFLNYYKPDPQTLQIVVLHDDSDQMEGSQKLTIGGGAGGHNGISSIYQYLPHLKERIWRLKIGIRPGMNKLKSETFVLQKISTNEKKHLADLTEIVQKNLNLFTQNGLDKLRTIINSF